MGYSVYDSNAAAKVEVMDLHCKLLIKVTVLSLLLCQATFTMTLVK